MLIAGVQPVTDEAYEAIVSLGTKGGWDGLLPSKGRKVNDVQEKKPETGKREPASKRKEAIADRLDKPPERRSKRTRK